MGRIALLHGANRSSILLVSTIILVLLWVTPKYLLKKSVKVKECTHEDRTEFGLCENCGQPEEWDYYI